MNCPLTNCGPGKCNRYNGWPPAGRYGDQTPVGARFSAPLHNGPGAQISSCAMGIGSLSRANVSGGGRGGGVDHTPTYSAEVKERVERYLYSPSGPSCPLFG